MKRIALSFLLVCLSGSPVYSGAPQRIISIAPSFTEILYALGMDEQIIATSNFCDYPPQALKTGKVGDVLNPNLEKIVRLKPDLVICGAWKWSLPEKLKSVGIDVLEIKDAENLEESIQRVMIIGNKIGRKEEAERLVSTMNSRIQAVRARSAGLPKRRAYVELDSGQWTVGGNSYLNDILQIIGLENIYGDRTEPYLMVTMESILSRDPDLLISLNRTKKDYAEMTVWQASRAVRNGWVIDRLALDWNSITHQSPRLADGIEELEKLVRKLFAGRPSP